MQTIYLHIGRGKTGTTLIQNYLSRRRSELLEQGVHYVFADDCGVGVGHQQFAKSFIDELPYYMIPPIEPQRVRKEVFSEINASAAKTILMSSEHFCMANIAEVFNYFKNLSGEYVVKIIMFIRSHDELMESEYNQLVKVKRETRPFAQYIVDELDAFRIEGIVGELVRYFGVENVIGKIYDGGKYNVLEQFFSCIPEIDQNLLQPFSQSESAASANPSLGIKALTVAKNLNGIELENRQELYATIFSQLAKDDLPALLFSSEQAREFREKFSSDNRAITGLFLGSPQDDLGGRRYCDLERTRIRELFTHLY